MTKLEKVLVTSAILATVFFVSIFVGFFLFVSCNSYEGYQGEYPELFSVAINSIPRTSGAVNIEIVAQPVVQVLEEDDYGRVLFCYTEETGIYSDDEERNEMPNGGVNLVICQSSDDGFAYYYEYVNYITSPLAKENGIGLWNMNLPATIKDPYNGIEESKIEELKQLNDWNKEINLDKCNKVKIVRKVER